MGRTVPLLVTSEQRRELEELAARRNLKQGHAQRVRVVLLAADAVAGGASARAVGRAQGPGTRDRRRGYAAGVPGRAERPKPAAGKPPPAATGAARVCR